MTTAKKQLLWCDHFLLAIIQHQALSRNQRNYCRSLPLNCSSPAIAISTRRLEFSATWTALCKSPRPTRQTFASNVHGTSEAETMWGKHTPLEEWSWLVGWPSLLMGNGPRTKLHPTQYHAFIQSAFPFFEYLNGLYEIPFQHLCIFYVHRITYIYIYTNAVLIYHHISM